MAKAKKRKAKKRQAVSRAERVEATPETLAKLRPCPLKAMLHQGAVDPHHPAGMQPDQYEAALQIWDAHDALVRSQKAGSVDLNKIANVHGDVSDGKARLIALYLEWGRELPQRLYLTADIVVGWIDDHEPARRMTNDRQRRTLVRACDLWIKLVDEANRRWRAERGFLDKFAA